jgi:hypothetical protein
LPNPTPRAYRPRKALHPRKVRGTAITHPRLLCVKGAVSSAD